ncbi:hypothetical protein HHI36_003769, partial [Cryptolaemus montrouzieri]
MYGSPEEPGVLEAYVPTSDIAITKVSKRNNIENITNYIKRNLPEAELRCEELKVKSGEYRSFKVSVLNLNVQCLLNEIDYLDYILNEEKFKIACLTETWMTKEQLDGLVIPHYNIASAFARVKCSSLMDIVNLYVEMHVELAAVVAT